MASGNEYSIEGYKESKERITVLVCSNAAATHKRKLTIVGKSAHPRALKNVEHLPVIYKSNKKTWVTQQLFQDWFNQNFVPEAKQHQRRINGLKKHTFTIRQLSSTARCKCYDI